MRLIEESKLHFFQARHHLLVDSIARYVFQKRSTYLWYRWFTSSIRNSVENLLGRTSNGAAQTCFGKWSCRSSSVEWSFGQVLLLALRCLPVSSFGYLFYVSFCTVTCFRLQARNLVPFNFILEFYIWKEPIGRRETLRWSWWHFEMGGVKEGLCTLIMAPDFFFIKFEIDNMCDVSGILLWTQARSTVR